MRFLKWKKEARRAAYYLVGRQSSLFECSPFVLAIKVHVDNVARGEEEKLARGAFSKRLNAIKGEKPPEGSCEFNGCLQGG